MRPSATDPLGVAVCGLGIGEQHALAFHRLSTCQLRWLYDLDAARAGEVAGRLGVGAVAPDFQTAVESPDVQIVSIASFDDAHFGQVLQALQTQRHVFVEKPICTAIDELRTMKRAWLAARKLHLASNLVLRAAPLYVWLRKAIQEGELGEIYAFDGDYLYGRIEKITQGWRKDVKDYCVMLGGGIHLVDLMLGITGEKPDTVTCSGNRVCTAGTNFRHDDFLAATYHFPSGLIGRITANFGCVHRHQHVVRIFGTKKTFIYDDQGARIHSSRDANASGAMLNLSPLPESKGALIPGFVEAILHSELHPERREEVAQREFDVMSVCLAAREAAGDVGPLKIQYV